MDIIEIKNLIEIRNKGIENQIKDIKNMYNIEITNKLLENTVVYSLNAIKYYNNKYNYFIGKEYEQLYLFGYKLYSIRNYNYNLLNSANYTNKQYTIFINKLDKELITKIISDIFIIIQIENITNKKII